MTARAETMARWIAAALNLVLDRVVPEPAIAAAADPAGPVGLVWTPHQPPVTPPAQRRWPPPHDLDDRNPRLCQRIGGCTIDPLDGWCDQCRAFTTRPPQRA